MVAQETPEPRTNGPDRDGIREITRQLYDAQKLRIAMGNRLAGQFRKDLGQEPGTKTEEMDEEARRVLDILKVEWPRLADAVAKTPTRRWNDLMAPHRAQQIADTEAWCQREEEALADGQDSLDVKEYKKRHAALVQRRRDLAEGRIPLIRTPQQIALLRHYLDMERSEVQLQGFIATLVEQFPIWQYLSADGPDGRSGVKGCGALMAAVLISELDPHRARHESSFWRFAGLDVSNEDGQGRSRRKEHQIKRTYIDRNGEEKERDSLTYNPFLKSKLMGALAPSLMRARGHYKAQYDMYKHRLESHPRYGVVRYLETTGATDDEGKVAHREARKEHRHDMAMRFMVKLFLADLWARWRELEGLPVAPFYPQAKLGMPPHHQYVPFRQYWPAKLEEEEDEREDGAAAAE